MRAARHGFHRFVSKEEIKVRLEPRGAEPRAVKAESEPSGSVRRSAEASET